MATLAAYGHSLTAILTLALTLASRGYRQSHDRRCGLPPSGRLGASLHISRRFFTLTIRQRLCLARGNPLPTATHPLHLTPPIHYPELRSTGAPYPTRRTGLAPSQPHISAPVIAPRPG